MSQHVILIQQQALQPRVRRVQLQYVSLFPSLSSNILISAPQNKLSSSSRHIGAIIGGVVGGVVLCLLAATTAFLFNRYHRKLRSKRTQQFVMRKGLVLSASPPLAAGDVKTAVVSLSTFGMYR